MVKYLSTATATTLYTLPTNRFLKMLSPSPYFTPTVCSRDVLFFVLAYCIIVLFYCIQPDQINMTVLFMASTTTVVHWTSHFLQGTRNTRPCITVNIHFLLFTMKKIMMMRRRGMVRLLYEYDQVVVPENLSTRRDYSIMHGL